jgi:hypothetical protein
MPVFRIGTQEGMGVRETAEDEEGRGFKIGNLRFQIMPTLAGVRISCWRFELSNR